MAAEPWGVVPPQVAVSQAKAHVVGSQSKPGGPVTPAGGFGHSYSQLTALHWYSGPGEGPPQSAGQKQAHTFALESHCALPSQAPPQSAAHSKSHTSGFVLQKKPVGVSPLQPPHS